MKTFFLKIFSGLTLILGIIVTILFGKLGKAETQKKVREIKKKTESEVANKTQREKEDYLSAI